MCHLGMLFMAARFVASLAIVGFGLYGLGVDNPIMDLMSSCGQWIFGVLVASGCLNLGNMIWCDVMKKGDCCKTKCGKK